MSRNTKPHRNTDLAVTKCYTCCDQAQRLLKLKKVLQHSSIQTQTTKD